jgi:hypothetical protein
VDEPRKVRRVVMGQEQLTVGPTVQLKDPVVEVGRYSTLIVYEPAYKAAGTGGVRIRNRPQFPNLETRGAPPMDQIYQIESGDGGAARRRRAGRGS